MLAYAFRFLDEQGYKSVGAETFTNAAELCAAILSKGLALQIKRGLGREYQTAHDILASPRGKFDLTESIKTFSLLKGQVFCEYDEFTVNSYMNRIIKSVAEYLLKADISPERRNELRRNLQYFQGIDSLDIFRIDWHFCFNRNNRSYRVLLAICYLIVKGLLQNTDDGEHRLENFNDSSMCRLYEKWILEYYKKEFPVLRAKASQIDWALDDGYSEMLPLMQSDITLSYKGKMFIIDAKYYGKSMYTHFDRTIVRSANIYQIFTYVKNWQAGYTDEEVAGMLLYAGTDEEIQPNYDYQMSGNRISVRTLNLNTDFSEISDQLDRIVEIYFDLSHN